MFSWLSKCGEEVCCHEAMCGCGALSLVHKRDSKRWRRGQDGGSAEGREGVVSPRTGIFPYSR